MHKKQETIAFFYYSTLTNKNKKKNAIRLIENFE